MNTLLENNQETDDLDPNSPHHHGHANKNKHKKKKHSSHESAPADDKGDVVIVEFLDTANDTSVTKFLN